MAKQKREIVAVFSAQNKAKGATAAFGRDMDSTGRAMKRMAAGALALAGVGGGLYVLKKGFMDVVKAASDAEETQAKFNTVFKNLSGQANDWAESFGDSVGRSRQSVKSWMAGLQDTFVPLGIARDEAFELAKSLATLAVDVASFNNAVDADVIRDFTSALVGNHETVRKFGIIISESALKQEAMRQGIEKTYKELTDLEKVQLRYNLILAGTTDAQGDAIRTSNSYANQMKRIRGTLDNIKVALGEDILPILATGLEDLNTLLRENEKVVEAWGSKIGSIFTPALEQDMYPALKVVIKTFGYLMSGIQTVRAALTQLTAGFFVASGGIVIAVGEIQIAMEKLNKFAAKSWLGKKLGVPVTEKGADWAAWGKTLIEEGKALDKAAGEMMLNLPSLKIAEKFEELDEIIRKSQKRRKMMEGGGLAPGTVAESAKTIKEQYADALRAKIDMIDKEIAKREELSDSVKKSAEEDKKVIIEAAQEQVKFVREQDYMTRTQRIQNLEAYVATHQEALDMVLEAEKILADELEKLERGKLDALKEWGRDASDVWLNIDKIAVSALDEMADALTDLCLTGKADFKALAQSVIYDITRMMIKMQMAQLLGIAPGGGGGIGDLFMAGVGALFGAAGAGAPGGPPTTAGVQRYTLGGYGGGLQHGGEVLKTGLAMVHKGEKYSGVGGGGGNLDVHIHNEGEEKFEISEVQEYALSDQRIIDVTIRAAGTHGPYRRSIKQIR